MQENLEKHAPYEIVVAEVDERTAFLIQSSISLVSLFQSPFNCRHKYCNYVQNLLEFHITGYQHTAKPHIQSQAVPCGNRSGKSGSGTDFSTGTPIFPLRII